MRRRDLFKYGLMGGVGLALPVGMHQSGWVRHRSPSVEPFTVPLPIPPILQPTRSDADGEIYELTQRVAIADILPDLPTEIWGYDGIFPGPTIEARRDRAVVVRHRNALPVPTVTHLHGGRTPPESDGYPTDLLLPTSAGSDGSTHAEHADDVAIGFRDYVYPNAQRGATLWYHDHRMDFTGPQVYRGLAGLYLIRDEVEDSLPLPRGDKEIPLVIADRLFHDDGSLFYPSKDSSLTGQPGVTGAYATDGVLGDTILVNGAPWPELEVANTRYRFRVLNASNARVYRLGLDPPADGDAFVQIGSDGGLLDAPRGCDSIQIAPAERFDLVIDFGRYDVGDTIVLRNLAVDDPLGMGRTSKILRFRVVRDERDDSAVPDRLAADDEEVPDPDRATVQRRFDFRQSGGMWAINGHAFDTDRIWADPKLDATEIWEFSGNNVGHPVHLHLVQFRVLTRNGRAPHGDDAGWKDTVFLGDDVRVVARFSGYPGKFVFHCHNLEHEDMMMMANFEVT